MAKVSWSAEEDAELRRLVETQGAKNWPQIAAGIPGRSGKSCRLRWRNQLDPTVDHRPFTSEEDALIVRLHAHHGNKWAAISRLLPGRSDNAVKNHFNSTLRRLKRRRIDIESGSDAARVQGPETALSLMPPGGGHNLGRPIAKEEEEEVFMRGLQRIIAEEVRKYMDEVIIKD